MNKQKLTAIMGIIAIFTMGVGCCRQNAVDGVQEVNFGPSRCDMEYYETAEYDWCAEYLLNIGIISSQRTNASMTLKQIPVILMRTMKKSIHLCMQIIFWRRAAKA